MSGTNWLDKLFTRYRQVNQAGAALIARASLNFTGAGVTVTDDPANDQTTITIPGASGTLEKYPSAAVTLANGNNNNAAWTNSTWAITGPSGAFALTGIAAAAADGTFIEIPNSTGFDMTIAHQSSSSTAANRIICPDGVDAVLPGLNGQTSFARLMYSAGSSRWILARGVGVAPEKTWSSSSVTLLAAPGGYFNRLTAGVTTVVLPAASTCIGQIAIVKFSNLASLSIGRTGSDLIDGLTSYATPSGNYQSASFKAISANVWDAYPGLA